MVSEIQYISGESVRALRSLRKMSQKEMAEKLNMTQGNFSRLERDKIKIRGERMKVIAAVLGYSLEFLVNFDVEREEIEDRAKDVYKEADVYQEVSDMKLMCDRHLFAIEALTAEFRRQVAQMHEKIAELGK